MACKTEVVTVGEREYSITQWGAKRALTMKFKIGRVVGPAFLAIANSLDLSELAKSKKAGSDASQIEAVASAFSKVFTENDPGDLTDLIVLTVGDVIAKGEGGGKITETKFEELFSGDDLFDCFKLFVHVIKVNFANFKFGQKAVDLMAGAVGKS